MRFQTGLKKKLPEGELRLILIGRKRWDFKQSLGKTRVQGVFPELWLTSHLFLPIRIKGNSPSGGFLFNSVWNLTFSDKKRRLSGSTNCRKKGYFFFDFDLWTSSEVISEVSTLVFTCTKHKKENRKESTFEAVTKVIQDSR